MLMQMIALANYQKTEVFNVFLSGLSLLIADYFHSQTVSISLLISMSEYNLTLFFQWYFLAQKHYGKLLPTVLFKHIK